MTDREQVFCPHCLEVVTCTTGMDTATDILKRLKPDEIVARLEEMDAEAKALRVLLRAARQRERNRTRKPKTEVPADE